MSYQVIARKWRPQTFEEVTGQETITHTLRNAVEHDRLHHAYLFSGARGVGKTTTARLLAKSLNCHSTDKPTPKSCNNCPSCKEIAEGRSIDVLEFDAASNTQVDKIRDLIIENINIAPARDRFKVFIIDEVHMLSNSSFNALLKTLEEPPPNIVFIMATTELHKVPDTILSRCQEFEFRTIPTAKIYERLNLIAEAEKVTVTAEALREIARSGEGSMRDAQSNFDQVISFSDETIDIEDVINALGIASSEILTRTVEAIAHRRPQEALFVVEDLIRRGQDLRNFCRDLLAFLRDLLVAKVTNHAEGLLDSAILDQEALIKYGEHFSESDLVRLFNSLAETEIQLKNATQPRYILEIGLVKLMELQRITAIEQILERLAKLENLAPAAEKKTLNEVSNLKSQVSSPGFEAQIPKTKTETFAVDFDLAEVPFPVNGQSKKVEFVNSKPAFEVSKSDVTEEKIENSQDLKMADAAPSISNYSPPITNKTPVINQQFFDSIPVKLPEISSEDLEHFDDSKLDSAYEERLLREGDNLKTIKNASEIVSVLLSASVVTTTISANGAAVAPAKEKPKITFQIPTFETENETSQVVTLSENPTEEELRLYAENHPLVKKALRIFRGKIIKVSKEN
ncbi:MAG: DNA polymerase III subunit gamma/tau [Pyrinomonadaceae bacterium]|nr:DNA polymerase III subunit gamma/tau [Pyrinomonadaceae bacterium]